MPNEGKSDTLSLHFFIGMNREKLLIIFVVAILIVSGLWFIFGGKLSTETSPPSAVSPAETIAEEKVLTATPVAPAAPALPTVSTNSVAAADQSSDEAISQILTDSNLSNSASVDKLLALLPKLDEAGQTEAAAHIANLSDDDDAKRWSQKVVEWDLPEPAADVLYQDLSNRPSEIGFPVLGAIADRPKHPKNKETLETLSVISDPPPAGTTWTQWVNQQLKEASQPQAP